MSEMRGGGDQIVVQGVRVPCFMYGTAWKEARTEELTRAALAAGFRAIDTANQRKHYLESGVGGAVRQRGIARSELFLQTKFTYVRGQDHRLPYDSSAPVALQVRQSRINPNKVYLNGYSAGGDGVYQLGPRMGERWAGAGMSAGHPNASSPLSLRNVPFAIHVGAADTAFERNKKAMEWGTRLEALAAADPRRLRQSVASPRRSAALDEPRGRSQHPVLAKSRARSDPTQSTRP